jgi:hypothetical protein
MAKIMYTITTSGGDRVNATMSAIGPKQTSLVALHMSAFGGEADMRFCGAYVCL